MEKKTLTAEQRLLLQLISCRQKTENTDLTSINWGDVINECRLHNVTLHAFENLISLRSGINEDWTKKWLSVTGLAVRHNENIYKEQNAIINLFEGNVKYVIIKGLALAKYYDKPNNRLMGDIDILVQPSQLKTAEKLLLGLGYKKAQYDSKHDVVFEKNGFFVELHYAVSGIPSGKYGDILRKKLSTVCESGVNEECLGYKFRAPNDCDHGLIMLLHLNHHFYYGRVIFKQLLDWAYYVNATAGAPFWKEELLPLLESVDMLDFAKIITKTCAVYLNSDLPDWAINVSKETADEVIEEIYRYGKNYERTSTYPSADTFLNDSYKPTGRTCAIMRALHSSVITNYPFVKKFAIAYPFLCAYKIVKYGVLVLFGKRNSLSSINAETKQKEKVYGKFNLFKKNKW